MRLIDADELKKKLKTVRKDFARNMIPYESVIGMIDLMPTVGGWISVDDRLPDKSGIYLMYTESGDVFSAEYDSCANNDCCFGWWQEYFDGKTLGYVGGEFEPVHGITHWRPMLEPPEEVQE